MSKKNNKNFAKKSFCVFNRAPSDTLKKNPAKLFINIFQRP